MRLALVMAVGAMSVTTAALADVDSAFAAAQATIAENQPALLFQDQSLEQVDGCVVSLTVEDISGAVPGQAFFRFDANMAALAPEETQRAEMGDFGIMLLVPTADGSPDVIETNTFIGTDDENMQAVIGSGGSCDGETCTLQSPGPYLRVAVIGDDAQTKTDTIVEALSALSAACK